MGISFINQYKKSKYMPLHYRSYNIKLVPEFNYTSEDIESQTTKGHIWRIKRFDVSWLGFGLHITNIPQYKEKKCKKK